MELRLIEKYKTTPKTVRATLWFTVSNVLQKGVLFLAVPIYTRILSTEQYGNYTVILSWLEIFEILTKFRIGWGGFVVGLNKYENERSSYTSSMQMLSIVVTTVTFAIYGIFRNYVCKLIGLENKYVVLIFGLMYVIPTIQFWTVRQRVEYKYMRVLGVSLVSGILVILSGTIMAVISEEKDFAVVLARLIIQGMIALGLLWINCHECFTFYRREYWIRALKFNIPLLPYYLSMVVLHGSDRIIIKDLVGSAQAGIYGVAYTFSTCMQLFNSSMTQTIQPWMYKRMKEEKIKEIPSILTLSTLIIILLNLLLIACAPEIIHFIVPERYREAVWIIPPLAASVVTMYCYQHFVNVEFYFEESKLTSLASIGAAVLNIWLNYICIPRFGYMAAAYTTLVCYVLFAFFHYYAMRIVCKKYDYKENLINMRRIILLLGGFAIIAIVLTIGYKVFLIRYCAILIMFVIAFMKRDELKKAMHTLLK